MMMVRTFAKETKSGHNLKGLNREFGATGWTGAGHQFWNGYVFAVRVTLVSKYYLKLWFCWRCLHFVCNFESDSDLDFELNLG